MSTEAIRYAESAKAIYTRAGLENRDPTPEERGEIERLLTKSRNARAGEEKAHEFGNAIGVEGFGHSGAGAFGGPGDAFVKSEGYRKIADPMTRGQT